MKNSNIKQTAVNVVRNIFGATHFILQSSSDIVLESEGIFVEKTIGTNRQEVKLERLDRTEYLQNKCVSKIQDLKARARAINNK